MPHEEAIKALNTQIEQGESVIREAKKDMEKYQNMINVANERAALVGNMIVAFEEAIKLLKMEA